jgi:hypothetical protein
MAQIKECSTLSSKVIEYLVRCFSIVVAQNKSDLEAMKSSLNALSHIPLVTMLVAMSHGADINKTPPTINTHIYHMARTCMALP